MTDLTITITAFDIAIFWIVIVGAIVAALLVYAKWIDTKGAAEARRIPPNYDEEGA